MVNNQINDCGCKAQLEKLCAGTKLAISATVLETIAH